MNLEAACGEQAAWRIAEVHGCAWQSRGVRARLTVSRNGTCAHQVSRCEAAGAADLLELAASPGWPMLLPLAEYDVRT